MVTENYGRVLKWKRPVKSGKNAREEYTLMWSTSKTPFVAQSWMEAGFVSKDPDDGLWSGFLLNGQETDFHPTMKAAKAALEELYFNIQTRKIKGGM